MHATQSSTTTRGNMLRSVRRHRELYLIFLPFALWFLIFQYVPMAGIIIAFKDYNIFSGFVDSPWVGFQNFIELFQSRSFVRAFRNTVIISVFRLVIGFPIPIIFAILLNEISAKRYRKFVQTSSYLPYFISWSVAGGLFYIILSPGSGFVNGIITSLGLDPINFLGNPSYFRGVVVATYVWKTFGWRAIIYLAALAGIDPNLYEAAKIDGAGRFRCMWNITLPSISGVIVVMLILALGQMLNIDFEQIFILVNDSVLRVGETLEFYVYRVGIYDSSNFSLATAVGFFKSLIGFALILAANAISKRFADGKGIW